MENCGTCYNYSLPSCNGNIKIKTGIANATNYFYKVVDKFGHAYTGECVADYADPNLIVLNPADFPDAFFNPYNGSYTISIVDAYDQVQAMEFGGYSFQAVCLEIFEYSGNVLNNVIK